MGRYGEIVDSGEVTHRGFTYTYEIYTDDDLGTPLEYMESPGIWIHDNATRSWSDVANGDSIWDAIDGPNPYARHEYDAQTRYDAWSERRYEELKAEYMPNGPTTDQTKDSVYRRAWHESHSLGSIVEWFERETNGIAMALYGFQHSGRAVSVHDFNDRWDSGAIGIVYMTPAMIRERMLWKRITKARREQMREYMVQDIDSVDNWLHGYTYGFVTYDEKGKEVDALWGHYDDWNAKYTIESATESIKGDIDGRYLDIEVKRVERLVADTGFMLGRMAMGRDEDDVLVNNRMTRMRAAVEGLPEWRRKEPLAVFDPAYEAAVTHPFLGANPSAWDSEVTTEYGSLR